MILEINKHRDRYQNITLFYGVRHPNEFAYSREFSLWEKNDIKIRTVISNNHHGEWKGPTGHVQQLLPQKSPHTVAFLCGVSGMVKELKEKLPSLGIEHILLNY